ncbi:hypothetical protein HYH02_001293 [Chlamydomonas schloesseri]|uniref:Uncharacterized protein n=1 Tax=Chlamydomonas schloesseri TaxID=2026947 RepID=A0A835WX81_9CHLO|nr:hypothetical protein HYH02_001293 [Chlamydomonas schloesseri]|eukprot:KAG2454261.1 hypothetical protein HYH02_001293 [Chlamydomonas schloesseri]
MTTPSSRISTSVRILRYPDGHERTIYYPVEVVSAAEPELKVELDPEEINWSLWTQTDEDESTCWNECGLAGAACVVADPDELAEELASLHHHHHHQWGAAAAHAGTATATGPHRHPANEDEMVRSSYQILTGSPWLLPRPLFVLAQESVLHEGQGSLYTLQTRINQEGAMDELAAVLKRPALSSALSFSRMKDGVLAFDRAEDAARFATCLEADLPGEVQVMEVDSRQLFLLTADSQAVVVYLPWSEFTPLPHQLATALRAGNTLPPPQ